MLNSKIDKRKSKISYISQEAKRKKIDAEIYKNVMGSFKRYFQSEELTEMTHDMKQGVVLSEDTKQGLMRLAN